MSLTFGGATSDRVVVTAAASIDTLTAWTWYTWVNPTTITAGRKIMQKLDSSSPFGGRDIRVVASNFIRVDVTRATTSTQYISNSNALSTNKWWFIAVTYDAAAAAGEVVNIYVGDLATLATESTYGTTTNGSGATTSDALGNLRIGNSTSGVQAWQGAIGLSGHFDRVMTLAEIQSHQFQPRVASGCVGFWNLGDNGTGTQPDYSGNGNAGTVTGASQSNNPPLRRPWGRRAVRGMPTTINAYTLTASGGSYTLTGTAATLRAGRHLSAGAGAFTLTGTDATLIYGSVGAYTLAANGGTFALTGGDANLIAARRLTASSGTFTLTGSDATLKAGRRLTASGGSYTLTGTAATLKAGRVIAANGGTFTLTGTAAALKAARRLSASGGVFALTGTDATLIYGQIGNFTLSAEGGTFTLTGGAAALTAARRLSAAGATYTLTGMDAALKAGRRLVASGGAFTLTGTDAALVYSGARSTAFYVTGRSGVRYQITADSGHRYIIEAASEPRYRATRRE